MLLALLACDGPGVVESHAVPGRTVHAEVERGDTEEPEARVYDDTLPREITWMGGGGLDTAIPEDTGWQFGDDALVGAVNETIRWIEVREEGVLVAYDDRLHALTVDTIEGRSPLLDALSPPLMESEPHDEGLGFTDFATWEGMGLATVEGEETVFLYEEIGGDWIMEYPWDSWRLDVGDVTGDGVEDIVKIDPLHDSTPDTVAISGTARGRLDLYDVAWEVRSQSSSDDIGFGVVVPGDLNGDGVDDVVVGGFYQASIWFGPLEGTQTPDSRDAVIEDVRGDWVKSVGDVDGDGYTELIGFVLGWTTRWYVAEVPTHRSFSMEDAMSVYECEGAVHHYLQDVHPISDGVHDWFVFDTHADTSALNVHLWIVPTERDGTVSCLDAGRRVRADYASPTLAAESPHGSSILIAGRRRAPQGRGANHPDVIAALPAAEWE